MGAGRNRTAAMAARQEAPEIMSRIVIDNVIKLFGTAPENALALARDGAGKERIMAETEQVLALDRVTLEINPGEVFAVIGLSGSGKSTLVRLINGLVRPTAGSVTVDGVDINAMDRLALQAFRRTGASMVFQGFGLFPHKRVIDNVAFGLDVRGEPAEVQRRAAEKWIDAVGLSGFADAFPHTLSGGMQQRVGLARALATDADILLMDEPFSALDPLTRRDMQDLLQELQSRLNKTIVLITHDLAEACRLGDRVAILKDGAVRQCATPEEIMASPADGYVRRFVTTMRHTS